MLVRYLIKLIAMMMLLACSIVDVMAQELLPFGQFTQQPWEAKYINLSFDGGDEIDENWYAADYDDSLWGTILGPISNNGALYYATGWEPEGSTYWVRRHFTLDSIDDSRAYVMHFIHDDGCQAYLNGELIYENGGVVGGYNNVVIDEDLLRTGDNLLAVMVSNSGWADAFMDFGLYAKDRVTDLTLSHSAVAVRQGESVPLEAFVNEDAYDKSVVWRAADGNIASVSESGVVYGNNLGHTTITVTSVTDPDISATCTVCVYEPDSVSWILPWGKEEAWTMKYKYYEVLDEYADPADDANGKKWIDSGYDDSAWETLSGPMASDGIWYSTWNHLWKGEYNCYCLRRTFTLSEIVEDATYRFMMQHDDDIKIYLNGQLVVHEADWTDERISIYQIPSDAFVVGENTLAIYIQQNWGGAFLDYGLEWEKFTSVTDLTLSQSAATLKINGYVQLDATVSEDATVSSVVWSVEDNTIASVSKDGKVRGKRAGTTTVTAASASNPEIKAVCTITVISELASLTTGWLLPKGEEEAWTMKYQFYELADSTMPGDDANGKSWTELGYDDSSWSTLTGPLGTNHPWEGDNNCYYLRRTFMLPEDLMGTFHFHTNHDDGIRVYINGQVAIEHEYDMRWHELVIPAEMFVAGENILAIYAQENGGYAYLDYGLHWTAPNAVTWLNISSAELTLNINETARLTAEVNADATDRSVIWSVADTTIATINANGLVIGVRTGTTTITATSISNPEITATCHVNVTPNVQPITILPWGTQEAWTAKYLYFEQTEYVEPENDVNGKSWKELEYDDSSWNTLTGPMGDKGEYNYWWSGEYNCYCLRRTFTMPEMERGVYTLDVIHDNGVEIYLNGRLVVKNSDWTHDQIVSYPIPEDAFVIGENMLAIYIKNEDGRTYLDYTLSFEHLIPVTNLDLSASELTLKMEEYVRLRATTNPEANNQQIAWSVADTTVATVSPSGRVKGVKTGTTFVVATSVSNPEVSDTCVVTVTTETFEAVLPDVEFEFFYEASNFDPTTQSIPNHPAANLEAYDLQLSAEIPTLNEDCLTFNGYCEGYIDKWEKGSYESGSYFYREGMDNMTIVCKVIPRFDAGNNSLDLIANREGGYNYMLRVGQHHSIFLHTGTAYEEHRSLRLPDTEEPQVLAVRVNGSEDFIMIDNLTTGDSHKVDGVNWGGAGTTMKIFYNNGDTEYWLGDFYWMYYSFEYLSDEQLEALSAWKDGGEVSPRYKVTISSSANGSVTGGGRYVEGTEATLTATPNENYRFVQWSDGSTANPYTFTVTENKELAAIFAFEGIQMGGEILPFGQYTGKPWGARYFHGLLDGGTAPAENWYEVGFDDSAWDSISGPISNIERIYHATPWEPEGSAYWVRRHFTLDSIAEDKTYMMHLFHDDGIKIYLNGHLIYENIGCVTNPYQVALDANMVQYLQQGENLLALTVSNSGMGDAGLDLGLYLDEKYPIEWMEMSEGEVTLDINESTQLYVRTNEEAFNKNLLWTVEDNAIVSITPAETAITPSCSVVGLKPGTTIVRATSVAYPEFSVSCTVTVTDDVFLNSYRLTFLVDGDVYHTDSVSYGTVLIPIAEPMKEGYTFSGWSEIPETMPAEDVTVTGFFVVNAKQTDGQGLVFHLNEEAYEMAGSTEALAEEVVIPSVLYGIPVTAIGDKAFMGTTGLKSVVIPSTVATVGDKAFYGCDDLLVVEWNTNAPVKGECFGEPDRHGNMLVFVGDESTPVTYEGNVVINGVAEAVVLTDGLPFRNPRVFTAANVSFTRKFTKRTKIGEAGGWEAMVLPFDVEHVESEEKGTLLPFGESDFSASLPYWIATMQADGTFVAANGIKANTPFIMEVPNGEEYEDIYNVEGTVTFSATDVTVHATANSQHPSANGYSLQASYEGVDAGSGIYALNDEEYVADGNTFLPGGVFVSASRDIRPFEAYVYSVSASRAPYLRIGAKGSTGIGGQLFIVNGGLSDVYDLMGRKIVVSDLRELPSGIYLINGAKVVVK